MLSDAQLAALTQDFYATVLSRENALRLLETQPANPTAAEVQAERWAKVAEQARQDLSVNNFSSTSFVSAALIKKHGLTLQLDDVALRQVNQAMLRASCDLAKALQARWEGNFNYEPQDHLLRLQLGRAEGERDKRSESSGQESGSTSVSRFERRIPARLFTEVAEEFRLSQMNVGQWEKQTGLQARKTYQLFSAHCGDRPLPDYVRADAISFRDLLVQLPASYGKAAEYRNLDAAEVVARTAGLDLDRLTPRTVQRHLAALSALWEQAIETEEIKENPFIGLKLPRAKRAQDQRAMWTSDKLCLLFNTPVWRGCFSHARRSKPGTQIIRDDKFWLPLIALFSGMRQEEICQLHVEDVRQEGAVWVFDINNRPPKKLKNRNAVRLVPVHQSLIAFGLLSYVEQQRGQGKKLIFDQLNPGGADQRFGHNFTKWFTRYRRDVRLYEKGVDFHSFRHSATTFMQWAGVPVPLIDALTGHATTGETARYTKHFQIMQLFEAVNSIDAGIDLSHLRGAE